MKKLKVLKKQVRKAAKSGASRAPRKVPLTARKICGPVFWGSLTKGERLFAGEYVYALVRNNKLGLVAAGKTSSNHLLYQRL